MKMKSEMNLGEFHMKHQTKSRAGVPRFQATRPSEFPTKDEKSRQILLIVNENYRSPSKARNQTNKYTKNNFFIETVYCISYMYAWRAFKIDDVHYMSLLYINSLTL